MGRIAGFIFLLAAFGEHLAIAQDESFFTESPRNLISSLEKDVRLRCSMYTKGMPPDINWLHDGEILEVADTNNIMVPLSDEGWISVSELSITSVKLSDSGAYQCIANTKGKEILSKEGTLKVEEISFIESPRNLTTSLGKDVKLHCSVHADGMPPVIYWLHDDEILEVATNDIIVPLRDEGWISVSELSITSVKLSDSGAYQCVAYIKGKEILSKEGTLKVEGIPIFLEEPQDLNVLADQPFNLSCFAQGHPEPIWVIWLQDGMPIDFLTDPLDQKPSTLTVYGLNRSSTFSCEAHNPKGVTMSRTATVKVTGHRLWKP